MKDRIEDYVLGRMNSDDNATFEKHMSEDSELRTMVHNFQALQRVSEGTLEMELLGEVEGIAQVSQHRNKVLKSRYRGVLGRAKYTWIGLLFLAVALILALLYFQNDSGLTEEQEQIFATLYERPNDENIERGNNDLADLSDFEKGKYYFSLNEWEKSKTYWKQFIIDSSGKDSLSTAHYFLGHIHMNQYEFSKARVAFAKSQRSEVPRYLDLIDKMEE